MYSGHSSVKNHPSFSLASRLGWLVLWCGISVIWKFGACWAGSVTHGVGTHQGFASPLQNCHSRMALLWSYEKCISMYVFSLSLSFVVSLLRGTSQVTMNTQKRSKRMEHCIEVKWVSATCQCSSTAMSAAPVGRMRRKNQRGQSWANWQDQMESKNTRVKNPERYYMEGLRHGYSKHDLLVTVVTNPLFSVVTVKGFTIKWRQVIKSRFHLSPSIITNMHKSDLDSLHPYDIFFYRSP